LAAFGRHRISHDRNPRPASPWSRAPWRRKTSLTRRITTSFLVFGVAILVSIATVLYYKGRVELERAAVSSLEVLAAEKQARLDAWFAQKMTQIELLAAAPTVKNEFLPLMAKPRGAWEGEPERESRERLTGFLSRVAIRTGRSFYSVFIMDAQSGQILIASEAADLGKFKEDRPYFIEGRKGSYVQRPFSSPSEGGASVVFSAPIKASDGSVAGVVAARADVDELHRIVEGPSSGLNTNDNFIVNRSGLYVTQPRFMPDQSILRFAAQTPYVKDCLTGNSGADFTGDYRSVPVIAVHRWIDSGDFCLIVKIDQAEALSAVSAFGKAILVTGMVAIIAAFCIAIALGRSIARPLKQLRDGVARISRGDRDVRLEDGPRDELGDLAREFNGMTSALAAGEVELKRRAEALQAANMALAQSNAALEVENSERRLAEEAVRGLNETLERRVNERTVELTAVNQELEAFVYAASHDLKAPLRVIDNTSKWLEDDLKGLLTSGPRDNLKMLRGRVRRMEKLLDDLLEYARLGRATDHRYEEAVTGDALMENILQLLSPPQGFRVNVSPEFARINVPRMPLQQIIMNLVGNAIKHHDRTHGRVDVTVEDCGPHYRFAVADDGPGIPVKYHAQVFKIFQTLKPRDQVEGSGVGLAIVRKHIELSGGELDLESSGGRGCIFRFTWPKRRERHDPGQASDGRADLPVETRLIKLTG
jgi:signal transduction histidine kinase